ncbi:MAG TPA: hypothetical protein VJ842_03180 [Pyrinomonadaceae bacterium]|nr:hypothetical protein [Pyrinomonadaceae bacterium]
MFGKIPAKIFLIFTLCLCLPTQAPARVQQMNRSGANPPTVLRDEAQTHRHKYHRHPRHRRKRGIRMSQQTKEAPSRDAAPETGTSAAGQQKEVEVKDDKAVEAKDDQPPVRPQVKRYDIKKNPPKGARRP